MNEGREERDQISLYQSHKRGHAIKKKRKICMIHQGRKL